MNPQNWYKDAGKPRFLFIVSGTLRKRGTLVSRNVIAIDQDSAQAKFLKKTRKTISAFTWIDIQLA